MSGRTGSENASSTVLASREGVAWSTTEVPFSPEEEDAIVTLVVVVIGIIIAIIVLFSMGIFIDCKHQQKGSLKRKKLRLKMPAIGRARRSGKEDGKSLASDMCPNGATETTGIRTTRDILV